MFSWRSGPKVFLPVENVIEERQIICICWKWEGKKPIYSLNWDDGDDLEMIKKFSSVISEADEAIAHNGDHFDMRWYNARHLLHGLEPIPLTKTVDTYKIAKKRFYLDSYRLEYIAQKVLGRGKIHTSFSLWKECMKITQLERAKRDLSLRKMVRYCKRDVAILELVWKHLSAYDPPATHAAVVETGKSMDRWKCAYCGSSDVHSNGRRVTAKGMLQHRMKCNGCGRFYSIAHAVF